MTLENILAKISFERLEPRIYSVTPVTFKYHALQEHVVSSLGPKSTVAYAAHADYGARLQADSKEVFASRSDTKKPDDITLLEQLLSDAYKTQIEITSIDMLPVTKKAVKEVHFLKHDEAWKYNHKLWVFKADPEKTLRELTIYYIASSHGVPTAKPIGYTPEISQQVYPYDIGILGGIVEHAGDSYNQLLYNMRFKPRRVHDMAVTIAGLIADCHLKLTASKQEFAQYNIALEHMTPEKALLQRLLAAQKTSKTHAAALIQACTDLYHKQSAPMVISHGDIHTGNIVTEEHVFVTNIQEFGLIDWDSISFDNPYSDLHDFWIHHKRHVEKCCAEYTFGFEELEEAYIARLAKSHHHFVANSKDSLIQSALWNLYEMYDPTRKELGDIASKALDHSIALHADLAKLETLGCKQEAFQILKGLRYAAHAKEQPIK